MKFKVSDFGNPSFCLSDFLYDHFCEGVEHSSHTLFFLHFIPIVHILLSQVELYIGKKFQMLIQIFQESTKFSVVHKLIVDSAPEFPRTLI